MDFETKVKSLKAIWVKRFLESSASKWKAAPCYFYKTYTSFFSANQPPIKIKPKFYQDIQNYWSKARTVDNTNIKVEMIEEQVIWNNRYITIAKQPFYWKRWTTNGIIFIKDLLGNNNKFMRHTQINNKYDIKSNFFDILQIRQSIPFACRNILNNSSKQKSNSTDTLFIDDKMYTSFTLNHKSYIQLTSSQKM